MRRSYVKINSDGSADVQYHNWVGEGIQTLSLDGRIDRDVISVFTSGHCHSFALAMHKLTGWKMVAVCLPGEYIDVPTVDEAPSHVMVQHPSGKYVDIHGFRDPHTDYPSVRRMASVSRKDIMGFRGYYSPNIKIAMPYVHTVLSKIGWSRSENQMAVHITTASAMMEV